MVILYNIGLCLFYGALLLVSVFNTKIRKWVKGRNAAIQSLKKQFAGKDKVAWIHCSSLGEFEQGRPVLEKFHEQNPQYKILLTFFSPSGYEMRKEYEHADYVSYLPLDTWINAHRFIKAVHPQIVFFVKYDFWYHHLHQAKKSGAELYLISAAFRPKQVFFKWYGGFFRSMLRTFNRIFVQNEESEQLLQKIGFKNIQITGDTRIDRVQQIAKQAENYPLIEEFAKNSPCLVCGSTWADDENILLTATKELTQLKLIIAPHQIHEAHIADIENLFADRRVVRYTQANGKDMTLYDVLIIDTIGMLSSIYRYGQAAYIGGGFEDGIHNTLEAVVYGIPVVFGSNYEKFIEAKELIELGGAISINDSDSLKPVLKNWFSNNNSRELAGEISKNYIWKQRNASEKILKDIEKHSSL